MSKEPSNPLESLPPEAGTKLEAICNRFEAAWRGPNRPQIESFLREIPEEISRLVLARKLILLDVVYRRENMETLRLEEYASRFPELETTWLEENVRPHVLSENGTIGRADLDRDKSAGGERSLLPQSISRYQVERILGEGGFGLVYLARDDQLQRLVAIKVPHSRLVTRTEDAEEYLTEARTVAKLDHPNIAPVYDVGSTDDCPFFIVSKFIDGGPLSETIAESLPSFSEAAEMVATIADALHYAHRMGLVHRDIKPGNILLDTGGKPFVVDFGLALKEKDVGKGPKYAGTPAYMSPEQARGEGHRVDGRSDVFSLGVVFYELLAGRRPFHAKLREDLMEQIITHEARPPRQSNDAIPKEVERVCLKALSKRASDRYTTAKDMADDLRHFLSQQPSDMAKSAESPPVRSVVRPPSTSGGSGTSVAPTTPTPSSPPVRIVPKGLRSFDAHDADFFLELLPGPRDRDGLPESIRFWKTRIEEMDPDNTFTVGLIYGPSGCGKSSLVKAGLLPRLAGDMIAVYVETTAEETETRLLNGLRKRCPALSGKLGLKETLAALRLGEGIPVGKKVVIVLDQFEQWLHAKNDEQNTELVQALRQCDGGRVQCVVMVRDDFWMAATRFIRELEIRLVDGQNFAAVDLFPVKHAEKVLASFGRAFGCLPEKASEATSEQKQFLEEAVAALAQEGKVVSVRLALFAEMMKGRAWSAGTLKAMGGAEGVGVTFLEETFSAANAPPEHRYHQKAARAVLRVLLPESGTDIKGHVRPRQELLETSGYGARPKDFDDLLRILDAETRLLTPTDPEGKEEGGGMNEENGKATGTSSDSSEIPPPSSLLFYQLTHDYLVPALRDWLTRKQKESRRGRAELLLADRSAVWNARSENRQLPSLLQWFQIRSLTAKKNWTPPQQKMMRKATRHHVLRTAVVALVLVLIGLGSWEGFGRLEGRRLRDRLLEATTADVPEIIKEMAPYRPWVNHLLQDAVARTEKENDSRKQLHASLALLPVDSGQVEYLYGRLLQGDPREVVVIRASLLGFKADLTERLWTLLEDPKKDQDQRFRASCALSVFAPADARWEQAAADVAATLVIQKPFVIGQWTEALKDVGHKLIPPLADFLVDEKRGVPERGLIASLYGTYASATPEAYARLEKQLANASEPNATVDAKIALAKRQASVGVALLAMGKGETVWPLLKHTPDPTLRSHLMERLGPAGIDPKDLIDRFEKEPEVSVKRALLLSLGEYGLDRLSLAERRNQMPWLLQMYRDHPDPGIHGAAEWLVRHWGEAKMLKATDGQIVGKLLVDQPPNAEQKERIGKFARDIEEIENSLAASEKARPARQAAWEQILRDSPLPMPASLAEGLVAHFPLDETEGKATANAVAGKPAALYLGKGDPAWTPGIVGEALRLDGFGTVAGGKPLNLEADQAFSYGCWFHYSAKVPMVLISTRDRNLGYRGFDLSLEQNHQLRMQMAGEDPKVPESSVAFSPFALTVIATTSVDPAQRPGWHHALVTYDGSKKAKGVRIYVDGQLQPTKVLEDRFVGTIPAAAPLYLGSRHGDYKFRGALDDVRIYDRRFSELEARQLYELGIQALARLPAKDRDPQQRQLVADHYRSQDESLQRLAKQLATARETAAQESVRKMGIAGGRQWYVNGVGQTMVVVRKPREFWMGEGPEKHRRTIDRSFAIGAKEVTVEEFRRFRKEHNVFEQYAPTGDCPVNSVTWYEAAEYCNWLSDREGIPKDQWCYEPNEVGKYAEGMKMAPNYLKRTGYRLPMEEEWEYACRAGCDTGYSSGETAELLGKYAWISENSLGKSHAVGLLKPNDIGVFDTHGNVWEWCQDTYGAYRIGGDGKTTRDEDIYKLPKDTHRVLRGGSFPLHAMNARAANRNSSSPAYRNDDLGFRLARTLTP